MNTNASASIGLSRGDAALPIRAVPARAATRPQRAEAMQKRGRVMIVAGFVITIVGVVLYCAACFAGGMDADMGDLLLDNAVPFARATLGVLGFGTLVWLIGSFMHLRGAMDADDDAGKTNASIES